MLVNGDGKEEGCCTGEGKEKLMKEEKEVWRRKLLKSCF